MCAGPTVHRVVSCSMQSTMASFPAMRMMEISPQIEPDLSGFRSKPLGVYVKVFPDRFNGGRKAHHGYRW